MVTLYIYIYIYIWYTYPADVGGVHACLITNTVVPVAPISINDSTLPSVCYTVIYMVRVGLELV